MMIKFDSYCDARSKIHNIYTTLFGANLLDKVEFTTRDGMRCYVNFDASVMVDADRVILRAKCFEDRRREMWEEPKQTMFGTERDLSITELSRLRDPAFALHGLQESMVAEITYHILHEVRRYA